MVLGLERLRQELVDSESRGRMVQEVLSKPPPPPPPPLRCHADIALLYVNMTTIFLCVYWIPF